MLAKPAAFVHVALMSGASVQGFWVYKKGLMVLMFNTEPGVFVPTTGPLTAIEDVDALMAPCRFASGQYLSTEWEPRVRLLQARAVDVVDLIDLLEDRRYQVDLAPPSFRSRPFRSL